MIWSSVIGCFSLRCTLGLVVDLCPSAFSPQAWLFFKEPDIFSLSYLCFGRLSRDGVSSCLSLLTAWFRSLFHSACLPWRRSAERRPTSSSSAPGFLWASAAASSSPRSGLETWHTTSCLLTWSACGRRRWTQLPSRTEHRFTVNKMEHWVLIISAAGGWFSWMIGLFWSFSLSLQLYLLLSDVVRCYSGFWFMHNFSFWASRHHAAAFNRSNDRPEEVGVCSIRSFLGVIVCHSDTIC